ncbi:MAG: NAD-dependent epimerase/dehydratase family protein, partial [Ignavibacteriae bacterium]|nr:NAD-dependent epimerase/dehydratase family protein [Ignavibacteriota bacterium]
MKNKILITGSAGFIGYHLSKRLCDVGYSIYGIDNLNNYYDVNLKRARLERLKDFNP